MTSGFALAGPMVAITFVLIIGTVASLRGAGSQMPTDRDGPGTPIKLS